MMTLQIAKKLFANFEAEQLTYCHWKSNQHLQEGLCGLTDLDLLALEEEAPKLERVFEQLAMVKVKATQQDYPGIEDWLGFDRASGALIHLHLHYKLVLGEKNLKSIHLPLENWLLKNSVSSEEVRIAAPECELMLLIIRAVLKIDSTDLIKALIKRSPSILPVGTRREFDWLLERWNRKHFVSLFKKSNLPLDLNIFLQFIEHYNKGSLTTFYLLRTRLYFLRRLKPYSRYSGFQAFLLRTGSFIKSLPVFKKGKNKSKKRLAGRTLFFALVGADGSGKSSLVRDLKKWLGWKLAVDQIYFGIPKQQLFRHFTKGLASVAREAKKISRRFKFSPLERIFKHCEKTFNALYWLYLGRSRLLKYKKALALAASGQVVIADRYPLEAFKKMKEPMDGPRIPSRPGPLLAKMASLEREYYQKISDPPLMLVLQADLNVLKERRSDLALSSHIEKCRAVNQIKACENVYIVNAEADYAEVLLTCKQLIWSYLHGSSKIE